MSPLKQLPSVENAIEELRKADRPSADLDDDFAKAVRWTTTREPPPYTSSIDAIKYLPRGWFIEKVRRPENSDVCHVTVRHLTERRAATAKHRCGSIALCIAVLKARFFERHGYSYNRRKVEAIIDDAEKIYGPALRRLAKE